MPMKTLSVRLEEETFNKLIVMAEVQGKRISDLARVMIENSLNNDDILTSLEISQLSNILNKLNKNSIIIKIGQVMVEAIKRNEKGEIIRKENGAIQFVTNPDLWKFGEDYLQLTEGEEG